MRLTLPLTVGVAVVMVAYACGGGPPPPPPGPDPDSLAREQRRRDSLEALARAREDSLRRAREEAERARLERERAEAARIEAETRRVREAVARRVHFDFDRSEIRPGTDTQVLEQKLAILRANSQLRVRITGHCDERGSDEYNLALGNRRSLSAKRWLVDRGIAENRIETASRGEEEPVAMGSNEEAWAQNRRDEFAIIAGGNQLRMPMGGM
jgi:peptidoglycan-associated lipoprotein